MMARSVVRRCFQVSPRGDVAVQDGAEGALDVADVGGVEHGGLDRLDNLDVHRHGFAPFAVAGARRNPPTVSRR